MGVRSRKATGRGEPEAAVRLGISSRRRGFIPSILDHCRPPILGLCVPPQGKEGDVAPPPFRRRRVKRTSSKWRTAARERRNPMPKKPPVVEERQCSRFGSLIRLRMMAYFRSSDELSNCCICGGEDHDEHFCPCNYIYGRFDSECCRGEGECSHGPGQHGITSWVHVKYLRRVIRVSNLPPGFRQRDLEELFSPFGPLLMCGVPRFYNGICCCSSEFRMWFGVVVFKKREDGEVAINEVNGYKAEGYKLRVDWAYPSCR